MGGQRDRRLMARAVVVAVFAAGVALVVWAQARLSPAEFASAVAAGAVLEVLRVRVRSGVSVSLVNLAAFTAVLLGGPALAVATAPGAVVGALRTLPSPRLAKSAFNFGQFAMAAFVAGLTYQAIAPQALVAGMDVALLATAGGLAALAATAVAYTVVNLGLVAVIVELSSGERLGSLVRSVAQGLVLQPLYLGLAVLAAVLIHEVHPAAVALLVVPALVARTGLLAFEKELEAYDELVLALVKIIEVKDGYTRGHAERVAQLAVAVGERLGYDYERLRCTRYAALLHDVGKVAVPLSILRKPGALDDDEYRRVKAHPEVGTDLLSGIEFLVPALPGVTYHHERVDGRGYPYDLRGEEIPELARLISVVDAFDAMTSTRAYRRALPTAEARRRIRAGSGTQFDPEFVAAFEQVIDRMVWKPTVLDEPDAEPDAEPRPLVAVESGRGRSAR